MPTQATTQAQLTIRRVDTAHVPETGMWTAWIVGHSAIWGVGKTEGQAIGDLWMYQGLLTAEGATRIAEGRQVWQEVQV